MRTSLKSLLLSTAIILTTLSSAQAALNPSNMVMTFDDEFSGSTIDSTKWNPYMFQGAVGNGEQERYRPDSIVADPAQGLARIRIDKRSYEGQPFSAGALTTMGKFSQTYGYFEMRAKLPGSQGYWPAFWLLSEDNVAPTEIDVFEVLGKDPTTRYMTYIYPDPTTGVKSSKEGITKGPDLSAGYHTYGIEWHPQSLTWYIDGVQQFTFTGAAVPSKPMYLIASAAIGGTWGGEADSTTILPNTMDIDYIRGYQFKDAPATTNPVGIDFKQATLSATTVKPGDTLTFTTEADFGKAYSNVTLQTFVMDLGMTTNYGGGYFPIGNVTAGTKVTGKVTTFKVPANFPNGVYALYDYAMTSTTTNWVQVGQFTVAGSSVSTAGNDMTPLSALPAAMSPGTSPAPLTATATTTSTSTSTSTSASTSTTAAGTTTTTTAAAPVNLIADPGFDNGTTSWGLSPTNAQIIKDPANPTNNILRLPGNPTSWSNGFIDVSSKVTPGASYTLTFQGRRSAVNPVPSTYAQVQVFDAHWNTLMVPMVPVSSTSFATYTYNFTLPATAHFVHIAAARSGGAATGFADFDNFSLTKK